MLKTKRTAAFYFALIGALPIPAILLLNLLSGGSDLTSIAKDPLNLMFEMGAERNGVLFFPMFVILVCTLLPQMEYRNNTWKQVFASPQTKSKLFLAKFLNINLLILMFLLSTLVLMFIAVLITHVALPELNLLNQPFNPLRLLARTANTYITMLALCTLQFWMGLRFRNFIVPVAIGLALWIMGMMMIFEFKSDMVEFYPYSFYIAPYMPELQSKLLQVALTSTAYLGLFLLLGFLDFRRRRLTS